MRVDQNTRAPVQRADEPQQPVRPSLQNTLARIRNEGVRNEELFQPAAPQAAPKNLLDRLESGLKQQLGKMGLTEKDLKEAGSALPHVLHAADALKHGDYAAAARDLQTISQAAPTLLPKMGRAVVNAIPEPLRKSLDQVRISPQQLGEGIKALPAAIETAQAISKGDWKSALKSAESIKDLAPGISQKLGRAAYNAIPQGLKDAAGKLGLSYRDMRQLGDALPHALDAAQALEKGDWKGALQSLDQMGKAAPRAFNKLGDAIVQRLPQGVKDAVGKLGLSTKDVKEIGAALPHVVDLAGQLSKGDWKGALESAKQIGNDAPDVVKRLGQQILDRVPKGVKDQISKLGISAQDAKELGSALPHVIDAAQALGKGDWKAAAAAAAEAGKAAPELTQKLGTAILNHVPQGVKDGLSKLGLSGKDLEQLGAALPHAANVVDALGKGDLAGAAKELEAVGSSAPDLVGKLGKAVADHIPQNLKDRLAGMGLGSDKLGQLGSKVGSAIDLAKNLESGNANGAIDSLSKLTGDANLKAKMAAGLGLSGADFEKGLAAGKLDIPGFATSGKLGNLPGAIGSNRLGMMDPQAALKAALANAPGVNLANGSFKVGGAVAQAQGQWGQPGGPLYMEGKVKFLDAEAGGYGYVNADLSKLKLQAGGAVDAGIYLVNAQGKITSNYGIGSTSIAGNAMVGAHAGAAGTVNVDPLHGTAMLHAEAEAFAGAQAGVEVQQTLGPVGAGAKASVEAGIGVDFGMDVGFQNGKFTYKLDIGAALGIGFDLKLNFSIDVKGIMKGAWDGIKAVGGAIADGAKKVAGWIGDGAKAVGGAIADGAKAVGGAIADGAKAVGGAIADGAKSVGHAIASVFSGW